MMENFWKTVTIDQELTHMMLAMICIPDYMNLCYHKNATIVTYAKCDFGNMN